MCEQCGCDHAVSVNRDQIHDVNNVVYRDQIHMNNVVYRDQIYDINNVVYGDQIYDMNNVVYRNRFMIRTMWCIGTDL